MLVRIYFCWTDYPRGGENHLLAQSRQIARLAISSEKFSETVAHVDNLLSIKEKCVA